MSHPAIPRFLHGAIVILKGTKTPVKIIGHKYEKEKHKYLIKLGAYNSWEKEENLMLYIEKPEPATIPFKENGAKAFVDKLITGEKQ